jgi:DNA-binding CsgD family transcriptional regulator
MSPAPAPPDRLLQRLSPREKDCLRLVFETHSSKEIARRLGISQTSVDTHIRNARAKLGVRDRVEAARRLAAHELGAPPDPTPPPVDAVPEPPGHPPRSRLPFTRPLEELSYPDRLLLVVGCTIFVAMAFGLLLPAFAAL